MRAMWVAAGVTCWLSAAGCGSGAAAPAAPAPPAPTATGLTITSGTDALRTGFFADFTVTAAMSDRTTQIVTGQATLSTSDPSIATIDASGRLTALKHGTVALNASYQGRAAARTINVVHNYAGTWNGTYALRSCSQTGIFLTSRYCQNAGTEPMPLGLELTQSGSNADRIAGSVSLRGLVGSVSGEVTADGRLVLNGSYVATMSGFNVRVDILSWATTPVGSTGMGGFFVYDLAIVGSDGAATQTNEILTVNKKLEGAGDR